ncbi:MAG: heme ABC exporter ATP-binding protein CcmA [Betaproteobacteria bacterium]|nr:MAG: heme ABC exporter ATP-binding protein CcmA [Betaproteobacteria bacterium]
MPLPDAAPHLKSIDLACRRGSRLLFKGLDFDVHPGQIVWVRGRNGRGKTSLLRLAAGLSTPEHGRIHASLGKRQLVFIAHANALKEDLTASEALAFLLRIHESRRDAPVRTLSQGQRRRVALARLAVESSASLWILDEPFDALDADGVELVNSLLSEHTKRAGSVLLTSHLPINATLLRPIEIDLDRYAA